VPVVTQLADLFWNLECCEDPAVKPSIELAKLALVTSKDEEEDEGDKAGTDSSNDTDVTLVEDGSTRVSAPPETMTASPVQGSFSILGKRSRGTGSKMDIDVPDADKDKDYVIVSKPGTPVQVPTGLPLTEHQTPPGGDVEMSEMEKPGPTVPIRKGTTGMMFGAVTYHSPIAFADFMCRSAARCFRMHGLMPFPTRMC
jgi:ubiquitin carboxyl-terminal hydrolase 25/28